MNHNISGTKEFGDIALHAEAFVDNYISKPDKFNPNAPQYSAAGGSVAVEHAAGHAASLSAQHLPSFGKNVTAAATVNLLQTENHRVDANAFTTHNMPKGPMPSFKTHGGGIDYQFRDVVNASAAMTHTPAFNHTNYSLSSGVNLHQTPSSSINLNVGTNRTDTQFGRGKWEKKVFLGFKKTF